MEQAASQSNNPEASASTLFVVATHVPTVRTCEQLARTLGSIFEFHGHDHFSHVLIVNNDSPDANVEAALRFGSAVLAAAMRSALA